MAKKIVLSPHKAMWKVEVDVQNFSREKALAVTVHLRRGKAHCNVWVKKDEGYERVLPERILGTPIPEMLMGEVYRLLEDPEKGMVITGNVNLSIAVLTLQKKCSKLAAKVQQNRGHKESGLVIEKERDFRVDDYIYCHSCGNIDLCDNFPFDAPEDEEWRERRCAVCHSDDGINLSNVPGCENCTMSNSVDKCRDCPNPRNYTKSLNR